MPNLLFYMLYIATSEFLQPAIFFRFQSNLLTSQPEYSIQRYYTNNIKQILIENFWKSSADIFKIPTHRTCDEYLTKCLHCNIIHLLTPYSTCIKSLSRTKPTRKIHAVKKLFTESNNFALTWDKKFFLWIQYGICEKNEEIPPSGPSGMIWSSHRATFSLTTIK